jgi:hypothetical protein
LRLFVKHADEVIKARDDKTQIANYLGVIEPTWVSNHQEYSLGYKYAWIYHYFLSRYGIRFYTFPD